ncbi:MAG: hypothetical protein MJ252_21300 [archaeon]|nr:hypothetical protein [archaeon]
MQSSYEEQCKETLHRFQSGKAYKDNSINPDDLDKSNTGCLCSKINASNKTPISKCCIM